VKFRQDITPQQEAIQDRLHQGFSSWTAEHSQRYPLMGVLPYWPNVFRDQRIDEPYKPVNKAAQFLSRNEATDSKLARPAIYLGKLAYLKALRETYAQSVGSKATANSIIYAFQATPAFGEDLNSPSIAEYAVECLADGRDNTIGLTSGHLDRLSDVGEFAGGLTLAITEEHGLKYIDRINMLVNKNMTRQTYKTRHIPVPVPWLITTGAGAYWGIPPGESAQKHGISEADAGVANTIISRRFATDKKKRDMVFAYVPTGSGAVKVTDATGEVVRLRLKDASYTSPLTVRCYGGIIPVNRYGNNIVVGSVIKNYKPDGTKKKEYEKILTDNVMEELALQAHELTGLPVEYTKLYPEKRFAEAA
jgi:hypothetical protein